MLEFIEEALDEIALAIERKIATARRLAVGLRRNHRRDALGAGALQRVDDDEQEELLETTSSKKRAEEIAEASLGLGYFQTVIYRENENGDLDEVDRVEHG